MKQHRLHRGITLGEILVSLAIIAILSAILFPAFVAARQKSRETTCISQMRQIAMAFQMYRQDHSGSDAGGSIQAMGLPVASAFENLKIAGYIKNIALCMCPNRFINPATLGAGDKAGCTYAITYRSFGSKINFPLEYTRDPTWPIVACEYHDAYMNAGKRPPHVTNYPQFIGVGLNGGLSRKYLLQHQSKP